MATIRRPYGHSADDKKYDGPPKAGSTGSGRILQSFKSIRRRRLLIGLLAVWILYLFFKNIPTDLPPVSQRYDHRYGALRPTVVGQRPLPEPAAPVIPSIPSSQTYDGPVRFYNLSSSLQGLWFGYHTKGDVLFAISNLKSASLVVIGACAMAMQNRTGVHVAYMGRQELDLHRILAVNGVTTADCPVQWHDARPDHAEESTDERMQHSVNGAVGHINNVIPLQAIFINDDDVKEDEFLLTAIHAKAKDLQLPVIAVPAGGQNSVPWVLSLDGSSLRQWNRVSVDIVIRAKPETAALLLRLLHSIKNADFTGLTYPRIIIELPAKADLFLLDKLSGFEWPPSSSRADSQLIIRRRIDSKLMTPALASLRTIESFYPVGKPTSHVMILSPNVELSASFYQFLIFTLLEFKYSMPMTQISDDLMGISLDLPSHDLDLKARPAPSIDSKDIPLLLWQAPSANAALFFGDKWLELHEFLSNRVNNDPDLVQSVPNSTTKSRDQPAWLKVVLELMQARGYYMLYPVAKDKKSALITIHEELHNAPEEYINLSSADEKKQQNEQSISEKDDVVTVLTPKVGEVEEKPMVSSSTFASMLGLKVRAGTGGLWPESNAIPIYSYDGQSLSWVESEAQADAFAESFALSVGGCPSTDKRSEEKGTIEWLFCSEK